MLSTKMIKFNYLIIASCLSLMITWVFFIYQRKKKVEEIYVVDLTSYKEFKPKKD